MNGNAIKKIVTDYLKTTHTDYAIMINGEWGCGKTFFVDTELSKEIVATTCPNNSEKYRPVYYSLFGISSSDEINLGIKRQIVIHRANEKEKAKKKKDDAATITGTTLGIIADVFSVDSKRLLNLYDLKDIPKNAVLIFDDLERSKMPLTELLGVINKYAVVDKKKVIVICNEMKIEKDFCDFKEKTIRFTLNFSPTQNEIFKKIVESKELPKEYQQFILNNLPLILETFNNGNCKNLRTFIFILDIFEKVYMEIKLHCQFEDDFLKGYFLFTIIYSIEYKNNQTKDKLNWFPSFLSQYGSSTLLSLIEKIENKNDEDDHKTFLGQLKKYKEENLRNIFGSTAIAQYIQFGDFNEDAFKEEILLEEKRYIILRKTEYGMTLNKMMDWRLIGDNELNNVLSNVERFLKEDKYTVVEISILYARYLILKSNNINCRDIDSTIFFDAVDRLKDRWILISTLDGEKSLYNWNLHG